MRSAEEASIRVAVLPPWWRTVWAYGLYGLVLIGGIFAVDRFQRRRLIARERERVRERELEQAREIERSPARLQEAHTELEQAHQHLQATQAQLVQQEKMASLGQLTAGIAHELKNPLNFINNFAEVNEELARELSQELAAHRDRRVADVLEDLDDLISGLKVNAVQITKHGRRADGIVQSMMEHASSESRERFRMEVNAFVDQYITLARQGKSAQLPGFEVRIVRAYDEAAGSVEMAPREMGRVLLNLLSNAFDAVHEQARAANGDYTPTVTVSTRRLEDGIEIRVADNGRGVPREAWDKIFEPFFTTKPTGSGTGLGLSLSYDIVTQGHGGTLTLEDTQGEGATFVVTLPLAAPQALDAG
jgi:signal transduction histidine kinase